MSRSIPALACALGGFFALAGEAFAQSAFEGSWSGTFVLSHEGEQIGVGLIDLTIGAGGQINGTAVGEDAEFVLIGAVAVDGSQVILNALPVSPENLGATLLGTATLGDQGQKLLMSLSSVPLARLQLEISLTRE